jgi:MFS family permease
MTTEPAGADDRLGPVFTRLWAASGISNLGDGVYAAALPLLAATLTSDPLAVSAVTFAQWLPWLLFGLLSGALLDRWDRRRVMWTVDLARFVVVGGLAVAVLAGVASIPLLMVAGFLLGTGQTLVDTAAVALLPAIVSRRPGRLERANGRLQGTQMVTDGLAGPPIGGALFAVAPWAAFAVDALSFAAGSALIASIRPDPGAAAPAEARVPLRAAIAEGLSWLRRHRLLRSLALMVAVTNLMAMATQAILVLFATRVLGLGSVGYGLLLAGVALGGVAGSLLAARVSRWLGPGTMMVGGFALAGLALVTTGLVSSPFLAGALLAVEALIIIMFNIVAGSLRQQLTPDHLLGRVISAFRLLGFGVVPLGALLGGVLASTFGLRAPFVVAGVVITASALAFAPVVSNRAIAAARDAAVPS